MNTLHCVGFICLYLCTDLYQLYRQNIHVKEVKESKSNLYHFPFNKLSRFKFIPPIRGKYTAYGKLLHAVLKAFPVRARELI
jgi:hypothetical protein